MASSDHSLAKMKKKKKKKTDDIRSSHFHAREPLYSKSAVIAWWSQSTSGKNVHLAVEKGNKFLNISLLRVFFADNCQ